MRVEDLKRWHWAIIGLALGVMVSLIRGAGGDEEALAERSTLDSSEFERLLLKKSRSGKRLVKDICVYRLPDGSYWLGAEQLMTRAKQETYVPVKIPTPTPYAPRQAPGRVG